jgi:cell shape-determining protein MreC
MNLSAIPSGLEVVIPVLVFVFASLQKWKRGITETWREEAEAQKLRADRLAEQVNELGEEIKALRRENAELRKMLSDRGFDIGTFLGRKEVE